MLHKYVVVRVPDSDDDDRNSSEFMLLRVFSGEFEQILAPKSNALRLTYEIPAFGKHDCRPDIVNPQRP